MVDVETYWEFGREETAGQIVVMGSMIGHQGTDGMERMEGMEGRGSPSSFDGPGAYTDDLRYR